MRKLILASFFALSVAACSSGGSSSSSSSNPQSGTVVGLGTPGSVSVVPAQ